MSKIAVIGGLNMDYMIQLDAFPNVGETVLGSHFFMSSGGKGGNQAVAAARLGGDVSIIGSIGNDQNGQELKDMVKSENIDASFLQTIEGVVTGVAFIEVSNCNNRIVVIPGTNNYTNESYMKEIEKELLEFDVFIFQLETPIDAIHYLFPILHQLGKTIILNPAPAIELESHLMEMVTYLTPNEHEVHVLFGKGENIEALLKKHPFKLIVTMGAEGVLFSDGEQIIRVPAIKTNPVDTTGAGDTFSGAFAVAIAEGMAVLRAIEFANVAAGMSITKPGAQAGMPTRKELEDFAGKAD